jgi:hypothetical protein
LFLGEFDKVPLSLFIAYLFAVTNFFVTSMAVKALLLQLKAMPLHAEAVPL